MEYITRAELLQFAEDTNLTEQASKRSNAESRGPSGATFLSHSTKDAELVFGAMKVLEGHGAKVYIDKKDPSLPPYTNKETANTLKDRIKQSNKFVLLASENSKSSSWVPWELGLADQAKGLSQVALFPAVKSRDETAWASAEYLGLYDRIVWGMLESEAKECWLVWDQRKNTATKLSNWLTR